MKAFIRETSKLVVVQKNKSQGYNVFFSSNQGGGAASQDQRSVSFDSEEDKYPISFDTETF